MNKLRADVKYSNWYKVQ